jgi:hypothetical protein
MSRAEKELSTLRAARDAARERLTGHANSFREALSPTTLRQRIARDVGARAQAVASEALEVATDSRGIVIGTAAVLGLWLARKPLMRALTSRLSGTKPEASGDGE